MQTGINAGRVLFEIAIVGRQNVERDIRQAESAMGRYAAALQGFAMDMTLRFSLMSGILVGFATMAATKFDKAMTETRRTSGLTREEIDALSRSFLNLSRTPLTVNAEGLAGLENAAQKLADISAVAGKLGFANKDEIEQFTIGIAKLTAVFDGLDPEETATKMAQIATAFGLPISQIERMGSIISEVDNRTKATTAELITFTQMTAGAGQNAGFSMPNIVAIGGAIKEVGLRTEVASTAMNQLFSRLAADPDKFAKIVGLSTAEFRQHIEKDAVGALLLWLETLKRLDKESEIKAIRELSLRGVRATNVITLLSERVDVLKNVLKIADDEARDNISLSRQWEVKNQSVAASINRMSNAGKALAIELGQNFFPVLESGIKIIERAVGAFESLPGWVKNFAFSIGIVLALAGPLTLFLGNGIKLLFDMGLAAKAAATQLALMKGAALFPGEFSGIAGLKTFLSLIGPSQAIMLAFIGVLLGGAAALAFLSDNSEEAKRRQAEYNTVLREATQKRIDENREIIKLSDSAKKLADADERSTDTVEKKRLLYAETNKLLPGLIANTDSLKDVVGKLGQSADVASGKIVDLNETLLELRQTEVGTMLIEAQVQVTQLESKFESAKKNFFAVTPETAKAFTDLTFKFADLFDFKDTGGLGIFPELKPEAMLRPDFRKRLSELIFEITRSIFEKFPIFEKAPESVQRFRDSLIDLQQTLISLDKEKAKLEQLSKVFDEFNKPKALETVKPPFDLEAAKGNVEGLRSQLATAKALLESAQEQTAEWVKSQREAGKAVSDEEQTIFLKRIVVAQNEAVGEIKAGTPVVDAYTESVTKLDRQLSVLFVNTFDLGELYKIRTEQIDLMREKNQELTLSFRDQKAPKVENPFVEAMQSLVYLVQLQQERYKNELRQAELDGKQDEFIEQNRARLEGIKKLREDIRAKVEQQLFIETGINDIEKATAEQLEELAEKMKDPEFAKAIQSLANLLRGLEAGERRGKKNGAFEDLQKEIEEMGVTARNVIEIMLNGFRRMNRRIVEMAWDGRLKLKEVWNGIAQDFLTMLLDQIMKKVFSNIITQILSLFGFSSQASSGSGVGGGMDDFVARNDGTIIPFSPDDNIIGYKSLNGLLGNILPSVVGPQFATIPNYNVNVPAPQVSVNNQPPKVEVIVQAEMDAMRFYRKTEPDYKAFKTRRRLTEP